MLELNEAVILWNSQSGEVRISPIKVASSEPKRFNNSAGAIYTKIKTMTTEQKTAYLFNLAMHLIIRDRINSGLVHQTFCYIKEYQLGFAKDMPGAVYDN